MFEEIKKDSQLSKIIRNFCEDNHFEICISDNLEENDENLLILKIDDYYSTKNFTKPPKSIDCLILVRCHNESFNMFLIELRNIKNSKGFNRKEIYQKFQNTFELFLNDEFSKIFVKYSYSNIKCYFVSDPYGYKKRDNSLTKENFLEKQHCKNLNKDWLMSFKPFKFKNRLYSISIEMPTPTIDEC